MNRASRLGIRSWATLLIAYALVLQGFLGAIAVGERIALADPFGIICAAKTSTLTFQDSAPDTPVPQSRRGDCCILGLFGGLAPHGAAATAATHANWTAIELDVRGLAVAHDQVRRGERYRPRAPPADA